MYIRQMLEKQLQKYFQGVFKDSGKNTEFPANPVSTTGFEISDTSP